MRESIRRVACIKRTYRGNGRVTYLGDCGAGGGTGCSNARRPPLGINGEDCALPIFSMHPEMELGVFYSLYSRISTNYLF